MYHFFNYYKMNKRDILNNILFKYEHKNKLSYFPEFVNLVLNHNIKYVRQQNLMSKCDNNIIINRNRRRSFVTTENKPIIWLYWNSGYDNLPEIIALSKKNLQSHLSKKYKIIYLDDNNISKYIDVNTYYYKYIKKHKSIQAFTDILRMDLLITYGGYWMDLTCITSFSELPKYNKNQAIIPRHLTDRHLKYDTWFLGSDIDDNFLIELRDYSIDILLNMSHTPYHFMGIMMDYLITIKDYKLNFLNIKREYFFYDNNDASLDLCREIYISVPVIKLDRHDKNRDKPYIKNFRIILSLE